MTSRFCETLLVVTTLIMPVAAAEKQSIEYADLASGKVQIIGRLGIPIGQIVRVDATVIAAEKLWPDSSEYKEQYLFSIHTIAGRKVTGFHIPFRVHDFAVSKLFPGRIELSEKLRDRLKRNPTEAEINSAEAELLSSGIRSYLVFEEITIFGMPENLPSNVTLWSGVSFGPYSSLRVIKELETTK